MARASYWESWQSGRLARRRVLQGGAGLLSGAAALALLGCGSSSSKPAGGGSSGGGGLVTKPVDTTSKAVKGGTFQWFGANDVQTFDTSSGFAGDVQHASHGYSRLVKYQAYKYPDQVRPEVVADAATSWEVSPDGLQVTYKLRPNFKFDPRPPTNGRVMNSADIKFSFDNFAAKSPNRGQLFNNVDPTSPVVGITTPDDSTAVIKLAFPYAPLNSILANFRFICVLPVEAGGKFDMRQDMRGTGAWRLSKFVPSDRVEYVKNPDWYDAANVNFDGIAYPLITEYATGVSQFRAGNVWTYPVKQEEVIAMKQALPSLQMTAEEDFPLNWIWYRYDYKPGSIFRDERVRKAMSLLLDRNLYIESFGNVSDFKKNGLAVPSRWNTVVPCGEEGYWLDPQDAKSFGDTASFFQYNPTDAKKMLQAAGAPSPIQSKLTFAAGMNIDNQVQVVQGMWEQNGDFKLQLTPSDFRSDFSPNFTNSADKFDGIAANTTAAPPEVDLQLNTYLRSGQPRSGHFDANGMPDTKLDDMLTRERVEQDLQKRIAVIQDIQRYAASKMYFLYTPGASLGFDVAWPWLANWAVYRAREGGSPVQETLYQMWYDASKKQ